MKTITVFTPTYNRKHTLPRTFESLCSQTCDEFEWLIIDDGSSDGTREWVESLGEKLSELSELNGVSELNKLNRLNGLSEAKMLCVDWMGRFFDRNVDDGVDHGDYVELNAQNYFQIIVHPTSSTLSTPSTSSTLSTSSTPSTLTITYIYKPNGGLYTGYNVAYQTIQTELCVCIDSDDYMPDDAVELIVDKWSKLSEVEKEKYCGMVGLDFNVVDKKPIGGYFKEGADGNALEMNHVGDTKYVFRTELMRQVAPMEGFEGEKDFNPHYMQMQVLDKYSILYMNENLCWVEYQTGGDSMSAAIWKQYWRSPKSYAKYRVQELKNSHGNSFIKKIRLCAHYVSSCMLSKDGDFLRNSPEKTLTFVSIPVGVLLFMLIMWKNRK